MVLITQSHICAAQASSSFKWLIMRKSTSTTPTFKTEALHLVSYVTTAVLNDCYSEVSAYTVLAYPHWASFS